MSVLNEMCSKRHWPPPRFEEMEEIGPAHNRTFRFKVLTHSLTAISLTVFVKISAPVLGVC